MPAFIGRFLRLGILVAIGTAPIAAIAMVTIASLSSAGMVRSAAAVLRIETVATMQVVDLALTFVTSALAFTTKSAVGALRIGVRMIRQTWPRSGLYVLCPPLALNMLNAVYPHRFPVLAMVAAAGLALLALIAKGATAAFYLREWPMGGETVLVPIDSVGLLPNQSCRSDADGHQVIDGRPGRLEPVGC